MSDFPVLGTDHLELYVGNARQAAAYYEHVFGFRTVAYRGPETGVPDTASYVVAQGAIRLVLTAALRQTHPVAAHVARHGDGVKAVALGVPDAHRAYALATERGAAGLTPPTRLTDEYGAATVAVIAAYGDTVHALVERAGYGGAFLPGYEPVAPYGTGGGSADRFAGRPPSPAPGPHGPVGLRSVDHCVANVAAGEMDRWVGFYRRVMGFELLVSFDDDAAIATEYSALMSKVVASGGGRVKLPINEPAEGRRRSQVEEYLAAYGGPGVQHVALATDDIVAAVDALRRRGVRFLEVPDAYYDDLAGRVGAIAEDLAELRRLRILADRDDEGYLLQIFTQPLQDRPTLFFEVIQRRGATSFGRGNFKALFEAIEREQARRGGL